MESVITRETLVLRGKHLEYFTIAWNSLEGLVAVIAGALRAAFHLWVSDRQFHRSNVRCCAALEECQLTLTCDTENETRNSVEDRGCLLCRSRPLRRL